jgi:hypothetical protein
MAVQITEEQVRQAEAEAEQAKAARIAAERAFATSPGTMRSYDEHQEAIHRAEHAKARFNMVRADFEAQQAQRAARAELLKAVEKEVAPVARKLVKSREAAVEALAEAEAAIAKALKVLGEHDQVVKETAVELWGRGLRGEDGEATGGLRDGSLLAGGERWNPVDAPGLLFAVLAECVKASHVRHRLGVVPQTSYVGTGRQMGVREFLDRLEAKRG